MKRYAKQKEKKLNFTKIFCEKYLEKIQRIKVFHNQNSVNLMTKKSKKLQQNPWLRHTTTLK